MTTCIDQLLLARRPLSELKQLRQAVAATAVAYEEVLDTTLDASEQRSGLTLPRPFPRAPTGMTGDMLLGRALRLGKANLLPPLHWLVLGASPVRSFSEVLFALDRIQGSDSECSNPDRWLDIVRDLENHAESIRTMLAEVESAVASALSSCSSLRRCA